MASVAKNSILYMASTILVNAASFILLPFYSYLIEPASMGKIYTVTAITQVLNLLIVLGLPVSISRFYFDCKSKEEVKILFSTIYILCSTIAFAFGLTMVALTGILCNLIKIEPIFVYSSVLISFLSTFFSMTIGLYYVMEKAATISIVSAMLGVLKIVIQLTLVLMMDNKAYAMLLSLVVNSFLEFSVSIYFAIPYLTRKFDFKPIGLYFKYSLSQLPSDLSKWLVTAANRLLLSGIKSSTEVGIFGLGNQLGMIPSIVFYSVNKAYVPYIFTNYKLKEAGDDNGANNAVNMTEKVFLLVTIMVTFFLPLSNNLMTIFSKDYSESSGVLFVILFSMMLDMYRVIFMQPLDFRVDYVLKKSIMWVLASIICFVLSLLLIPRYSIYGACAANLIYNVIVLVSVLLLSRRAMQLPYHERRILLTFMLSLVFMSSYTLGSSFAALVIKIILGTFYALLASRIMKFDIVGYVRFYVSKVIKRI